MAFRRRGKRRRKGITRKAPTRFRRRPALRTNLNIRTGGFLGQELKFYDSKLADTNIASSADGSGIEADPSATIVLNTATQGDGEQQRDGRKMIMKSIFISGIAIIGPTTDGTTPEAVPDIAIWLVLDTQTNGATIVSENVFTNKSGVISGGTSMMRNLQFATRFRILDKIQFTMPRPQQSGDSTNFDVQGSCVKWKLSANLNNMPVLFTNTTETVANITNNSLHILAVTTSTSMSPTITYNSRLRFIG